MEAQIYKQDITSAIKKAEDFLLFCKKQKILNIQNEFDQCHATLQSVLKRVELLSRKQNLNNIRILLLGDDDLLSLALTAAFPDIYITVFDLDEKVIDYINSFNQGTRLETYLADIRLPLPETLKGKFDIVFSDPPYTLAGQIVFLQRAISAIRSVPGSSIYICFSRCYLKPFAVNEIIKFAQSANLHLQSILEDYNFYDTPLDVMEDILKADTNSPAHILTSSLFLFETKENDIYLPDLPHYYLTGIYNYEDNNAST